MAGHVKCCSRRRYDIIYITYITYIIFPAGVSFSLIHLAFHLASATSDSAIHHKRTHNRYAGPAHAVYFATYEAVKHLMGGNKAGVHHPLAAGKHSTSELSYAG